MYVDLVSWTICKLPMVKHGVKLSDFWGDADARLVLFDRPARSDDDRYHHQCDNRYFLKFQASATTATAATAVVRAIDVALYRSAARPTTRSFCRASIRWTLAHRRTTTTRVRS
jgi:hypothetical protein